MLVAQLDRASVSEAEGLEFESQRARIDANMNKYLDLIADIATFYRRWHSLETARSSDKSEVIDFDYCPSDVANDTSAFANRFSAFKALEAIQSDLACANPKDFANHEFLSLKLKGSSAYLRALLGERIDFAEYIESTIGIIPERVGNDRLDSMAESLVASFAKKGLAWKRTDKEEYDKISRYENLGQLSNELRRHADFWVERVKSQLNLAVKPEFDIVECSEDAYWRNWIDGGLERRIRLRINTHARLTYRKGQEVELAGHEIAGHALNILELDASRRQGKVDRSALITTVHTCESFQFEGLAQSVLHLVGEQSELPEDFLIEDLLHQFHLAVLNNAHIELEEGQPLSLLVDDLMRRAPFLDEQRILADLNDRSRNPMFRTLMFVYYPSKIAFLRARQLSREERYAFLRSMYGKLWTPKQIQSLLEVRGSVA